MSEAATRTTVDLVEDTLSEISDVRSWIDKGHPAGETDRVYRGLANATKMLDKLKQSLVAGGNGAPPAEAT